MFFVFFSGVFAVSLLKGLLFWLSFLQRKQYRADRLWAAFQQPAFWRLLASPYRLAVVGLLLSWQIGVRFFQSALAFDVLAFAAAVLFASQSVITMRQARRKRLETPAFTPKIVVVGAIVLCIEIVLLRVPWFGTPQLWSLQIISPEHALTIEFIQPFLVFAVFFLLALPNMALQRRLVNRASRARRQHAHVNVVGITGSVGKTSMKEFVAHVLSAQGQVLKTPAHVNVDTGVAKQVLEELDGRYQWYVVEMGAYRPGEIKSICDIVAPKYGIITALSNQHLELFGTRERLRNAKFELVDSVKDQENLFMNAGSEPLRQACSERGIRPHWYGLHAEAVLSPTDISFTENGVEFRLQGIPFQIPGFGTARLVNALGAITFGRHVGIPLQALAEKCRSLPIISQSMQTRSGRQGTLIIDSSYNASVDSVIQAVRDLALVPRKRKIVVFKDVIELGPEAEVSHQAIADALAESGAEILLLASPWQAFMQQRLAARRVDSGQIHLSPPPARLESWLGEQSAVLCLGRETEPFVSQIAL